MTLSTEVTRVFDWRWNEKSIVLQEKGGQLEVDVDGKIYRLAALLVRDESVQPKLERASRIFPTFDRMALLDFCAQSEVFRITDKRVYMRRLVPSFVLDEYSLRLSEWVAAIGKDYSLWVEGVLRNGKLFRLAARFEQQTGDPICLGRILIYRGRVVLDQHPTTPPESIMGTRPLPPSNRRRLIRRLLKEARTEELYFSDSFVILGPQYKKASREAARRFKAHASNCLQLMLSPDGEDGSIYQHSESSCSWAMNRVRRYFPLAD